MRCFFVLALFGLSGCGEQERGEAPLSGEAELLLSTTSGQEEPMSLNEASVDNYGAPSEVDQPPLFRECDAPDFFERLFAAYDSNRSDDLESDEEQDIRDARDGRGEVHDRMLHHRWHFLNWLYDANDDDDLSDEERSVLLDDHTERCDNIHDAIVGEFDADEDGVLSQAEQANAAEEMMQRHADHRAQMQSRHFDGHKRGHHRGHRGHRGMPDIPPPVLSEFDGDGDGSLSKEESALARTELRDRIRAGEPPTGPEHR